LIQSVFMLGASWFKSKNFIKTFLSIVVFWMLVGTITMLFGCFLFKEQLWSVFDNHGQALNICTNINSDNFESFIDNFILFMKILFYGVMAPVCWFGSWLKLKEVEVQDGI
ncbi:MAG: hypothetical protein PQJ46_11635, partial [Spirochaetales bacterium]|nr:hypothetical protein [Spirochaetales bacterium]